MTPEELERFLIAHAVELGIVPIGRNAEGVMVFKIVRQGS